LEQEKTQGLSPAAGASFQGRPGAEVFCFFEEEGNAKKQSQYNPDIDMRGEKWYFLRKYRNL